ncbi:MAG TPA: SulP family inorganic anion transporter, partial [Gammaproteobacteria bacterium]|nr:SulP family inorganic anion transporter [Gammaproteobacteria bacterium]
VNFISPSVIVGFTAGAAILIASSQVGNLLGLAPEESVSGMAAIRQALQPEMLPRSAVSVLLFLLTVGVFLLIRRFRRRWPALLIAMILVSACAWLAGVSAWRVPMVGAMPAALPPLSMPLLSPTVLQGLIPGALVVAVLGLVQAMSVARALATRSGQRLDSNREFVGQGLANVVGSFFSSYPGSGSLTRSGLNYEIGARTPLAGIFSSLVLALVLLAAPEAGAYLPIPVVAGVIVMVAWSLLDLTAMRRIFRSSREETAVLTASLLSALLVSLEFSIAIGVISSLIFYLRRASKPRVVPVAPHPQRPNRGLRNAEKHGLKECPGLRILRLDGSLFFGAVDNVERELQRLTAAPQPKRVLLVCHAVNLIDLAGVDMLVREAERLAQEGGELYLCGLRDQPRRSLEQGAKGSRITSNHIFGDPAVALAALAPDCLNTSN